MAMGLYAACVRPLLFQVDPERIHHRAMAGLRCMPGFGRQLFHRRLHVGHAALSQRLWGIDFTNPVGLAAGFDKDAIAIEPLAAMGFSHLEVGTVTGQAQPGNPKPRCFRLPADHGLINRMGFNNHGATAMAERLAVAYDVAGGRRRPPCVLGINLGKTKLVALEEAVDDYRASVAALGKFADYLVVNVSSPNTPGLRDLQSEAALRPLLQGVRTAVDEHAPGTPLLLKIAPDLDPAGIDAAVDVALETGCEGLICTNTTIGRSGLRTDRQRVEAIGAGGLSGQPMRQLSTQVLARVARRVDGAVPIVGVGGIEDAEAAWEKICHGASLVQIYTGFIYGGPAVVRRVNRGLLGLLQRHGLRSIREAVGRSL
jgi:dihydroorotate dehydrogenase